MGIWRAVALVLAVISVIAITALAAAVRAGADPATLLFVVAALPAVVLGIFVSWRSGSRGVGAALMLVGALPLVVFAGEAWAQTTWPGAATVALLASGDWIFLYLAPIVLALVFPTGRLLSPRWRVVAVACVLVPAAYVVGVVVAPASLDVLPTLLLPVMLAVLVSSVASVALRYRRGDEATRRQVRWLAVSAIIAPAALVACWLGFVLFQSEAIVGVALIVLYMALAASVGIALLRHNLYGFDRVLSRTVLWAVLIALLGLLFSVLVVVLGLVLGGASPIVAALATLSCSLLFFPLHRALRRAIDARFQPARERALRAVRQFVVAVQAGLAQPEQLEGVLQGATGDLDLRVVEASIVGGDAASLTVVDIRELETEARLPLELSRLRADLREALEQTAASRARLVRAADEERGRIQRDLHDGAQQNLVALGMRLRALQRADIGNADELGDAVELVQQTIAEVRSLAQGVRPSALDDGLESALRTMVKNVPLPVDLDLHALDLHEPVAAAAYYVAAEAVTNALKHADAQRITISLRRVGDETVLWVSDDGAGGASVAGGSGLAGIRDRVEAAGGTLVVRSSLGAGTEIEAVFR